MDVFHRMAYAAAANLLGVSASHRISNDQLAEQFQRIALEDPELDEYYSRMASAVPVLQVKRAMEDLEIERPHAA